MENKGAELVAKLLEVNKTLIYVDLSFNGIGNLGAVALSKALETNTTLLTLNLNENEIGDPGALALSTVLKTNTTLYSLDLGDNNITNKGNKHWLEVFKPTAITSSTYVNTTLIELTLGTTDDDCHC